MAGHVTVAPHDGALDGVKAAQTMLLGAQPLRQRHAAVAILGTPAISSLQCPGYLRPISQG